MRYASNVTTTQTPAHPKYRADIDGLRAIAVLAVVLNHLSAPLISGGYVGVDVFFVISGYLITCIISREIEDGSFTFAKFYERRARRIFPALFAMLAVTLVVSYFVLLPSDYAGAFRSALGTLFFASNIVFWHELKEGYFAATDAGLNPLLHTWSLAVEEQFYVFFPVLLLVSYRHFRRHIILILIVCSVVSLVSAVQLVQNHRAAVFFLSPFRGWELLVGSLLAFSAVPPLRSRVVREAVAGAGMLAILIACFLYDGHTTFPGFATLMPVLGTAAIIHAGASGSTLVGHFLQWRPVVYIGLISYSLYLWHWPLIVLARYLMGVEALAQHIALLLIASLALGSLSYRFIEQPFRKGLQITRKYVFLSTAVFVSMLAVVSSIGLIKGGFDHRFEPAVTQLDSARWPDIPYSKCIQAPVGTNCTLGTADVKPTMLLWGDSHLLAWTPVLNDSLTTKGSRAVLAYSPICPPLFGVSNVNKAICTDQNLSVKNYLIANPDVKTVVMAAMWSAYFINEGPLTATAGYPVATGIEAASNSLTSTLQWLHDNGRHVILIGPVPVYDKSVPLSLALEQVTGRKFKTSSMAEQRQINASFYKVVDIAQRGGGDFIFIDPIQWLCAQECMVMKGGIPLYRDSNHLSVVGAMSMEMYLRTGL